MAKKAKSNGHKPKRKYGPRKSAEEQVRLIERATILLRSGKKTAEVAAKLGVKTHWVYYHVKNVVEHRHAA